MPRQPGDSPDTYHEPYFMGVEQTGPDTWVVEVAVVNYNLEDDERTSGQFARLILDYDPFDPDNGVQFENDIAEVAQEAEDLYPEGN